jgi:hypothetical protein
MADDRNMDASLAFLGCLPHMGKHKCGIGSICTLSKFVDTLSLGELLVIAGEHRVYTFGHLLFEINIPGGQERPRFSFCDAKVLLAEKLGRVKGGLGVSLSVV